MGAPRLSDPDNPPRAESRTAKAERLVREGRVELLWVGGPDNWRALVDGATDTYYATRTPEGRTCECRYGAEPTPCSHSLAADAAAMGVVAAKEVSA